MERGLGNQAILAKIDKLRELNVGSMIPLPQVCKIPMTDLEPRSRVCSLLSSATSRLERAQFWKA